MRKIDKRIGANWRENKSCSIKNTKIYKEKNKLILSLHGNEIARKNLDGSNLEINFCGWNTPTTRARLNSIDNMLHVKQKNHGIVVKYYGALFENVKDIGWLNFRNMEKEIKNNENNYFL